MEPTRQLNVFISYAHEDETFKQELDKHLVMLKRSGKVAVWNDRQLVAGQEWDAAIRNELANAHIILLLVSADFNNSDYIWNKELAVAMERHAAGSACVIPVILRKCQWFEMPYAKLQALPTGARPVTDFADRDEAFSNVADGVKAAAERLLRTSASLTQS